MVVAPAEHGRIVVEGVSKSFGPVRAVNELSFVVEPGGVTGFLGPNGAGKTTTLRMLLGLVTPDSGVARIGSRRYADLPTPAHEVGAVLDASGFHPARSGRDHLRVSCTLGGLPLRRVDEVLDLVGLSDAGTRRVRGYSLGMRQRLALAGALLGDPPVLILDEPTNGLDPEGIAWMRRLLQGFAEQGRTVLVSSHVLSEVQQLVDQVVIIRRGQLVHHGPLAELSGPDAHVVSIRSPRTEALTAALSAAEGCRVERAGPDRLRVTGVPASRIGDIAFAAGVMLHELTPHAVGLEDVFFSLTNATGTDSDPGVDPPGGAVTCGR